METALTIVIVILAALFVGARLARPFRHRSTEPCGSGGCDGCPASGDDCHPTRSGPFVVLGAVLLLAALPVPVLAADTIETWTPGATDVELYLGVDQLTDAGEARSFYGDFVVGFGLVERFSAFLGATLKANGALGGPSPHLHFGGFGTVVDSDHFDLDVIVHIGAGGADFGEFEVVPQLELNFDHDPDLATWGGYLRIGVPVFGRPQLTGSPSAGTTEAAFAVELTAGGYVQVADGHQLLLELDAAFRADAGDDERTAELGGVVLGYNAVLSDALELVTQVAVDLPQSGEPVGVGLMVGFIATLER